MVDPDSRIQNPIIIDFWLFTKFYAVILFTVADGPYELSIIF